MPIERIKDAARVKSGRASRRRGGNLEREAERWYVTRGWVVVRNTRGPFDMICLKAGERARVVEVKGSTGFRNYPPAERALTIAAALQAGADAYLWRRPKGARQPEEVASTNWPQQ
jgi:Holliday junction resolvase